MVRNSDFVELVDELMDVLGINTFYEGITVPSKFYELSPIWRGFYRFRANGSLAKAIKLFESEGDEEAEKEFEKVMKSELDYRFVHAVLYGLLKDIELRYLITTETY